MADEQLQLDLPSVIKSQFGDGRVQQVNNDGSANIQIADKDGNTQVIKFDPIAYSKANGIDPSKVKVQYNSPETALDENPIGFADGLKMAMSDDKNQAMQLQEKYGKDNVMKSPDGLLVNDKGTWKKADPGFLNKMFTSLPEMAAGAEGAKWGAIAGTAIAGPIGTVVGGLLGGAGAAALATIVKNKGAEALNLRTEQDASEAAKTFGHEAVNNLIWGTALAGTGLVLKGGVNLTKGVVQKVWNGVDKEGLAAMAEKLLPGTSKVDWGTVVRSPEDAKAIHSGIDAMAEYGKKAADSVVKGPDPMIRNMTKTVRDFMGQAKTAAEDQYGQMWGDLEKAGILQKPVTVAGSATELKTSMIKMGLLDKGADGVLKFNPKPQSEDAERILQVFDAKSRNTIKQVFDQVTSVAKDGGEISFGKAKALMNGVDDILENSGFYNHGENALSNNVRRALAQFRSGLSNDVSEGLKPHNLSMEGKSVNALAYFKDVSGKYSQYRSVMDDFALPSKFGGDLRQVMATTERMLGEKGYGLEDNFVRLGSAVGKDTEPVLQSLQQMRAARNLSELYTPAKGVLSWTRETVTGGPRDWAKRMATATQTKETFNKQWNESLLGKIPASSGSKALVEARGRMVDFINMITPEDRMKLITNPAALRQMVTAVESTPQLQQSMVGQLLAPLKDMAKPPQQGQ